MGRGMISVLHPTWCLPDCILPLVYSILKLSPEGLSSFWVLDMLVPFQGSDVAIKKHDIDIPFCICKELGWFHHFIFKVIA